MPPSTEDDYGLRISDCGLRIIIAAELSGRDLNMDAQQIKARTKKFALEVIRLVEKLPNSRSADIIGKQLIRCGTSVGANYRAACRAKSQADFIFKMGIVEEEADETIYWLEMLVETGMIGKEAFERLADEANQILAIVVASIRTARMNKKAASQ